MAQRWLSTATYLCPFPLTYYSPHVYPSLIYYPVHCCLPFHSPSPLPLRLPIPRSLPRRRLSGIFPSLLSLSPFASPIHSFTAVSFSSLPCFSFASPSLPHASSSPLSPSSSSSFASSLLLLRSFTSSSSLSLSAPSVSQHLLRRRLACPGAALVTAGGGVPSPRVNYERVCPSAAQVGEAYHLVRRADPLLRGMSSWSSMTRGGEWVSACFYFIPGSYNAACRINLFLLFIIPGVLPKHRAKLCFTWYVFLLL